MGSDARRMLVAADAERRRLERMLHDGAQQRLAATLTTLALAERRLEAGEPGAAELVKDAGDELRRCLEDLRDLARAIYPTVVAERGLSGALNDLARRAPGRVEVTAALSARLPEAVEVSAYLVASEALAALPEDGEATLSADLREGGLSLDIRGSMLSGEALERLRGRVTAFGGSIETALEEAFVKGRIPLETERSAD
jgi:signal transduction histidine kinase